MTMRRDFVEIDHICYLIPLHLMSVMSDLSRLAITLLCTASSDVHTKRAFNDEQNPEIPIVTAQQGYSTLAQRSIRRPLRLCGHTANTRHPKLVTN
jgi:hypothetical protein